MRRQTHNFADMLGGIGAAWPHKTGTSRDEMRRWFDEARPQRASDAEDAVRDQIRALSALHAVGDSTVPE